MTSEPSGQAATGAEIWIICGNSCAGKTTTARLLAQRLPLAAHIDGIFCWTAGLKLPGW